MDDILPSFHYPHSMLAEIHEQPAVLTATLAAYTGPAAEASLAPLRAWLAGTRRIVIAASGSSRHAGMLAETLIEELAGLAVDVEYASEYALWPAGRGVDAAVAVVSQSGETADTLAALRRANTAGCRTLAITNVPGSTMAREAGFRFDVLAGRERAIPATKSFTAQAMNLLLLALAAPHPAAPRPAAHTTLSRGLPELPAAIARQLPAWQQATEALALRYRETPNFLFLGRGLHYPIAREGALKLKESAYVHAEGYPAGELPHGPNALVDAHTPLVAIVTFDPADPASCARHAADLRLLATMRTQGAEIVALANADDAETRALAHHVLPIEPMPEPLLAIAEVVPLQLFAYAMAVVRGIDVDHPRNLTKAVLAG